MEDRASRLPFAIAGLCAAVVSAWLSLLASGGMDSDWLLGGVMALGCGVLAVNLLNRLAPGLFAGPPAVESRADIGVTTADEPAPAAPRLRVLLASSGLEGVAVALLTIYLMGDVVIAVAAGLALGGLAVCVSVLLSRALAAPA